MLEFTCRCDKCGFYVTTIPSLDDLVDKLPIGFTDVRSGTIPYVLCDKCLNELKTIVAKTIDEFVKKGEE